MSLIPSERLTSSYIIYAADNKVTVSWRYGRLYFHMKGYFSGFPVHHLRDYVT